MDNSGGDLPGALRAGDPMFGLGYAPPVAERVFVSLGAPGANERVQVAEEVPVAFVYNGRSHAVMMATPEDLEDFGVGFSLGEGIVAGAAEVASLSVVRHGRGIELQMEIPTARSALIEARARQLVGRTGCGLCGVESIEEALRPIPAVPGQDPLPIEALWKAEEALGALQRHNIETGSMHAAAWADRAGTIHVVREDVGRHNALDKVLGALARAGTDPSAGFIVMTSRASYELVQKAAAAGVPLLAAISRPTGLAIRLAEAAGMTLVGLLRGRSANVYSRPEGIARHREG